MRVGLMSMAYYFAQHIGVEFGDWETLSFAIPVLVCAAQDVKELLR